jgi:hypothetical protein
MVGRSPDRTVDGVSKVAEIPANNAVIRVSDGADGFTDGDVVMVAEWDGTSIATKLGNLADAQAAADNSDGALLNVETNVDEVDGTYKNV